jgi:hypothetical protein
MSEVKFMTELTIVKNPRYDKLAVLYSKVADLKAYISDSDDKTLESFDDGITEAFNDLCKKLMNNMMKRKYPVDKICDVLGVDAPTLERLDDELGDEEAEKLALDRVIEAGFEAMRKDCLENGISDKELMNEFGITQEDLDNDPYKEDL